MAQSIAEARIVSMSPNTHLEPHEVAAYVDRASSAVERERIEAHLAECADCRAEVAGVAGVVAAAGSRRAGLRTWVAAAAAAVVLFVAWPRDVRDPALIHREAPVTGTVVPRALAPTGITSGPIVLRWSAVPKADDYRVRIFDAQGSVQFERVTSDTLVAVGAVGLRPDVPYYWKVEARGGFDRSAASELIEFRIRSREP